MEFNKLFRPSVGADLSRTPPIYRPSRWVFLYPDYFLKLHYRPQWLVRNPVEKTLFAPTMQTMQNML
jgi:hypothetical protein